MTNIHCHQTGSTRRTFGMARSMKNRTYRPRPHRIPPENDSDSGWNENLYPQTYRANTPSQVSPRQPPPGWPKGMRKESIPTLSHTANDPTPNGNNNKIQEMEVYYEPAERISNGVIISCTNMISKKAFDYID